MERKYRNLIKALGLAALVSVPSYAQTPTPTPTPAATATPAPFQPNAQQQPLLTAFQQAQTAATAAQTELDRLRAAQPPTPAEQITAAQTALTNAQNALTQARTAATAAGIPETALAPANGNPAAPQPLTVNAVGPDGQPLGGNPANIAAAAAEQGMPATGIAGARPEDAGQLKLGEQVPSAAGIPNANLQTNWTATDPSGNTVPVGANGTPGAPGATQIPSLPNPGPLNITNEGMNKPPIAIKDPPPAIDPPPPVPEQDKETEVIQDNNENTEIRVTQGDDKDAQTDGDKPKDPEPVQEDPGQTEQANAPKPEVDVAGQVSFIVLDRTSPELLVKGKSQGLAFCLEVSEPTVTEGTGEAADANPTGSEKPVERKENRRPGDKNHNASRTGAPFSPDIAKGNIENPSEFKLDDKLIAGVRYSEAELEALIKESGPFPKDKIDYLSDPVFVPAGEETELNAKPADNNKNKGNTIDFNISPKTNNDSGMDMEMSPPAEDGSVDLVVKFRTANFDPDAEEPKAPEAEEGEEGQDEEQDADQADQADQADADEKAEDEKAEDEKSEDEKAAAPATDGEVDKANDEEEDREEAAEDGKDQYAIVFKLKDRAGNELNVELPFKVFDKGFAADQLGASTTSPAAPEASPAASPEASPAASPEATPATSGDASADPVNN